MIRFKKYLVYTPAVLVILLICVCAYAVPVRIATENDIGGIQQQISSSSVDFAAYTSIGRLPEWLFNNYTNTHKFPLICDGEPGATGATGPTGPTGATGPGVPVGGADGQLLSKKGLSNYSTQWINPTSSVAWGAITGVIGDQTDLAATFEPKNTNIQAHIGSTNNPHATTADQVLPSQTGNNGKILGTDGSTASWVAGGAGTPGGSNKSVQYNNGGAFGGFGRYSSGCLIL